MEKIEFKNHLYPALLKQIQNPPSVLYIKGKLPPDDKLKIAIVGTRKATADGLCLAEKFAKELSRNGLIIVSGLALGIDSAAHKGALKAEAATLAVLGSGLDKVYPVLNENLAKQILEKNGALLSEYAPETPIFASNFPARNRIIAGISTAVIIIEAPLKSGALITASFALEQGKEVFVAPGPASHPNYKGSHHLIRDGARIVTEPEQILEDLNISSQLCLDPVRGGLNLKKEEEIILDLIKKEKFLPIDKIIKTTKLSPQIVNKTLTFLLLKNLIKEELEGYKIKS